MALFWTAWGRLRRGDGPGAAIRAAAAAAVLIAAFVLAATDSH